MLGILDRLDEGILDDRKETYAANLRLCGKVEYCSYILTIYMHSQMERGLQFFMEVTYLAK